MPCLKFKTCVMYFRWWPVVPGSESTFPVEIQLYFRNRILVFFSFCFFSVLCHWQVGSLKSVFVLINVWVVGRKERLVNIMEWLESLSCTIRRQHCWGNQEEWIKNTAVVLKIWASYRKYERLKRMVKGLASFFSKTVENM